MKRRISHAEPMRSTWTSRRVTQTLTQDAAFYAAAFSADGKALYVSGGNDDLIYAYTWNNGAAALDKKIVLGKQKEDKTGSRYPAGMAASKKGNLLYVTGKDKKP